MAGLGISLSAGTLTGRFVAPGLGPVANGTLLLTLSQAAQLPGSFALVPETVACATSVDGSVVGVPNPTTAASGAAIAGMGTLPAGTYFVELAYTGAGSSSTLASPEAMFTLTAPGKLQISPPALQPAAAAGYAVYIGTSSGTETFQGSVAGFGGFTQSSALTAGAALPGSNNTSCTLTFNDVTIPSYTFYAAQLSDAAGNVLPGYPQNWYLSGTTLDVSNIIPLASNPAVRFPMPILANPASTAAQSIDSSINMNFFAINATANVGPGFFSAYWAGALPAAGTTLAVWTPNTGVILRRLDINAQTAGSGGSVGATITVSDGTSTCTFGSVLGGAASSGSVGFPTGACSFGGGVALTVRLAGDDHSVAPQNVSWSLEQTAR